MPIVLFDLVGAGDRRFSAHCWRSRFALAHKGLAYETRATRFTDIPKIADGRQKTVPVIDDGGTVVGDSWAIADYLEGAYPGTPSIFGGAQGRAHALFMHYWMVSISLPMLRFILPDLFANLDPADKDYFRASREKRFGKTLEDFSAGPVEARREALLQAMEPARAVIRKQKYLAGDAPLYPDFLLASYVLWARAMCPVKVFGADDPLEAWFERMLDLYGGLARAQKAAW